MAIAYLQAVEHIALQAAVLEDCVSSGMAYARLSCNGQASLPSFSSEFAHALAQVSHQALSSLTKVSASKCTAAAKGMMCLKECA